MSGSEGPCYGPLPSQKVAEVWALGFYRVYKGYKRVWGLGGYIRDIEGYPN